MCGTTRVDIAVVVGLGPIEFLLKDPEVTEVIVNGPGDVYVERKRRIERGRSPTGQRACGARA
jgi:type IV secretory pathway ATPase VirB11/archaellum biosynthesis ATPase